MKKGLSALMVLLTMLSLGMTARASDLPTIPLTPHIAGDANADRSIDLRDVMVISLYLADGWGTTVNKKNADVNGDGVVDLKDAVLLRRYLAGGWGVTLV